VRRAGYFAGATSLTGVSSAGDRMSVDYCMTIVSQFLAKLLAANRSLSHANRVSGRSFPRSGETVFGRQRQKAPNCL
jgi:hypothetical protein